MHTIDYFEYFHQAKNLSQLQQRLALCLQRWNITYYAFTYYTRHPTSENKLKYEYASKAYRPWHEYYLSEHLEDIDPTMNKIVKSNLPIFWDVKQQLAEATNQKQQDMRLSAIKFGLEKGLCIPIHGCYEDFAILVVAQGAGQHCMKEWKKIAPELLSLGHYYYHYVKKLLVKAQTKDTSYKFTKRQKQCLMLLIERASVEEIARALHITERTVNHHIQKINKILGSRNKHQSVAKAIAKNIIQY